MTKVCTCSYLVRINTIVARYLKAQAGRCLAMESINEISTTTHLNSKVVALDPA